MTIAVGIDVGGTRKGFHAVALQGCDVIESHRETDAHAMTLWCVAMHASAVAVDSPAGWGNQDGLRLAELELKEEGIHFYATPTAARAKERSFYRWMLNGAELFSALESQFVRLDRPANPPVVPVCFETFPHAIVVRLTKGRAPTGSKVVHRRTVLRDVGIDATKLSNVDFVDAGLCAVAARRYLAGQADFLGNREGGYLVLPSRANR